MYLPLSIPLWIAGALELTGDPRCPGRGAVEEAYAALHMPALRATVRVAVLQESEGPRIELRDGTDTLVAAQALAPEASCREIADAVAATIAVWQVPEVAFGAASPAATVAPRGDEGAALHSALARDLIEPPPAEDEIPIEPRDPPHPRRPRRWDVSASALFVVPFDSPCALCSSSVGFALRASWNPWVGGFGEDLMLDVPGQQSGALSPASFAAPVISWQRPSAGLGGHYRFLTDRPGLTVDAFMGGAVGWETSSAGQQDVNAGLKAGVRAALPLYPVQVTFEAGQFWWPPQPSPRNGPPFTLPQWEGWFSVGLGFGG